MHLFLSGAAKPKSETIAWYENEETHRTHSSSATAHSSPVYDYIIPGHVACSHKREHYKALTHATCLDDRMSKFYLMFGTIIHQTSPGPSDDLKANEGIPKALTPVVIAIPEETSNSLEEGQTTCAHPLPLQREPTSRPSPKRVESRATRQSEADKALQVRVTQTKGSKKGSYQHYVCRKKRMCGSPRSP